MMTSIILIDLSWGQRKLKLKLKLKQKAKMMIEGDFQLFFNFDLEFFNNRWANPAYTQAQSVSSSPFRGRATA